MTPATLQATAVRCGATPAESRYVVAFAVLESSCRNVKPYWDVRQTSYGYFAFGRARWVESGGASRTWGTAPTDEQVRVMLRAIRRYHRQAVKRGYAPESVAYLRALARQHNNGSIGRNAETRYTVRYRAAVRRNTGR